MTLSKDDQGKKDIANSPYVSPDVYQTVKEMIDPVPERRRKNPPKKDRTWDDGPKKPDEDDDSFKKSTTPAAGKKQI